MTAVVTELQRHPRPRQDRIAAEAIGKAGGEVTLAEQAIYALDGLPVTASVRVRLAADALSSIEAASHSLMLARAALLRHMLGGGQ